MDEVLIYDIETSSKKVSEAVPRIIGWWSTKYNDYFWTTDLAQFQQAVDEHKFICGYNSIEYDNPIMIKHGISFKYKIQLDLMQIIHGSGFGKDKGRKTIMQVPSGEHMAKVCHGKSLRETALALECSQKMDFEDYEMFKVPFDELSDEKQAIALEYLEADVIATRDIYFYLEEFFKDLRDGGIIVDEELSSHGFGPIGTFLPYNTDEVIRKKQYLTKSVASWTYATICNLAGLPVEYQDQEAVPYGGGFVSEPLVEMNDTQRHSDDWKRVKKAGSVSGSLYALDYNSLYPHIMIQMNLYGPKCKYQHSQNQGQTYFHNVFATDGNAVQGQGICYTDGYYSKEISKVSLLLKKFYELRNKYKAEKDERQYTVKIIINTIYGLLGNPSFKSVYSLISASDCTRLGRQWINEARDHFAREGYEICYTDTDSVYLRDPYNDKERLMKVKDGHIKNIKSQCLFPVDTFDMGVDAEMDYMFFVPKGDGSWVKKSYFYVKRHRDGTRSVEITGHAIGNSKSSPLSKQVYKKHIEPMILSDLKHKVKKSRVEYWISNEIRADPSLIAKSYNVNDPSEYNSPNSIHYQIAKALGAGRHSLIKCRFEHSRGVGKSRNYVPIEYIDEVKLSMIDLDSVWSELDVFIDRDEKGLGAFI